MSIATVRRIAMNALSVLTSDVAGRVATFALYAMVGRYLGPADFGKVSLALAFFYPAQVLAVAGLKVMLTREVTRRPDMARTYLVNASTVVVGASLLSVTVVALLVAALGYPRETSLIIVGTALALLPFALAAVSEGIFQALECMHLIAYAQVPANAAKIALAFVLLEAGGGVRGLIALIVGIYVLIMVAEWALLLPRIGIPRELPSVPFARRLVRSTGPFLGIEGLVAVTASAGIIILSQFVSERQVGLYSAANQVMVPVALVVTSTVLSTFPVMSRRYDLGGTALRDATRVLLGLLLGLAVPAAIALAYAAEDVLVLFYGDPSFAQSAVVVRIAVWGVLCMAASAVLGQSLMAANREMTNVRIVAVNAVVSIVVGVALISTYGLVGAAVSAVVVQAINLGQHYVPVARLLPELSLAPLLAKRVFAGLCMGGVLVAIGQGNVIVGLAAGLSAYAVALFIVEMVSAGGPRALRAKYRVIWSS